MDSEVTSVKTTRTQRRSRVNRNDIEIGAQSETDQWTRRRAKHRVENETNKATIETFLGFGEVMLYSEKLHHEEKLKDESMLLKQIMKKCKVVTDADKETLSGTQISSRRRSSRTTPARLHRTCTVERRNTNLEDDNTADIHTKMFGWIENAVARKET